MWLPATATFAGSESARYGGFPNAVDCGHNEMKGLTMVLSAAEEVAAQGMISPYVFGGFAFLALAALLVITAMINVDR